MQHPHMPAQAQKRGWRTHQCCQAQQSYGPSQFQRLYYRSIGNRSRKGWGPKDLQGYIPIYLEKCMVHESAAQLYTGIPTERAL